MKSEEKKKYTISEILDGCYYKHMVYGEVQIITKVDWPEYPDGVWKVYSLAASTEFYAFNVKYFEEIE